MLGARTVIDVLMQAQREGMIDNPDHNRCTPHIRERSTDRRIGDAQNDHCKQEQD